jgi:hypothetical protein
MKEPRLRRCLQPTASGWEDRQFGMKQHHDLVPNLAVSQPIQVMSKIRMISEASSAWKVSSP